MLPITASYQDCLQELLRKEEQVASQLRDAHEQANRSIERAWREAEQIKASASEEAEKQASEIIDPASRGHKRRVGSAAGFKRHPLRGRSIGGHAIWPHA